MTTLLVNQPLGVRHITPPGHPERPERLAAVDKALSKKRFNALLRREAPSGDPALADLVHGPSYLSQLQKARPAMGLNQLDPDTFISEDSFDAVATALGGALMALEAVVLGEADNAFCAIRPPGHHAEIHRPMGFCLINTVAVLARMAQRKHGADRIAIVDFDVHHGNGTQDIFKDDASVLYASIHQMPLYPGTGAKTETGVGNIFNAPLDPGTDGERMRTAFRDVVLPSIADFAPDIILVSAGFDADRRDPLAQLNWGPDDFAWATGKLMDLAATHCEHRLVSLLEGGYDLDGLADGAAAHVGMLLNGVADPISQGE